MNIQENFLMILNQLYQIIFSPFNRLLILTCSSQIASMIAKVIIHSIKVRKISFKNMANYGGMPSSHTVFITSFVFGVALDPDFGWQHPFFAFSIILSALILTDAIRLRGTIDKLNDILRVVVNKDKSLKESVKFPASIAHTTAEVICGIIFAFLYTIVFYLFLYNIFPS
jgi:acid phosphatase family membrane protein YuiD